VGRAGGRLRHTPLNEKPTSRRAIGDANRRVMKRGDPSRDMKASIKIYDAITSIKLMEAPA